MPDFLDIKADLSVTPTGEITGLAWPWGIPDRVGDVMTKGAMTLPQTLPMLWTHDQSEVIGVWDQITQTDQGVEVKGRLFLGDIPKASEVLTMIRAKAVTGLSIGFKTLDAKRTKTGREIIKADLLEISIVAVPAHPAAQITSLKSDGTTTSKGNTMPEPIDTKTADTTPADTTPANDAPAVDTKAFDAMKARLDQLEAKAARPQNMTAAPAIHSTDETKAFGDYLRTGDDTEVKTLAYGAGTGGILAPETVATTILEKVAEFSPMRSISGSIQMSGPLLQLPRLVDEVDPATVAEGGTKPESEPTFEQIDLKPFEMGVIVPVFKTLIEDAHVDLSGYLANHVARRFGQKEAAWFVNGDGTTQAEGVLTSTEVTDNAVAALDADTLIDHFYSVKTAYSRNGTWLMNRKTIGHVHKLKDSEGRSLWQPSLAAGAPPSLLGRPVLEAVDMPDAVSGNSPIIFGDFREGYTIADRIGFEIIRDELTEAAIGRVKFIARRRVGGRVTMGEALSKMTLS